MRNDRFTKVIVWIVIVGLVLGMGLTAIALFT